MIKLGGILKLLAFQEQNCSLTLKEGIEVYNQYLLDNNKKLLVDKDNSTLIRDHDASHVIFGLDTSLEEESFLDSWLIFGCSYKLRYLLSYTKLPELKGLTKYLAKEIGYRKFVSLYIKIIPTHFKIFKKIKKMKKRWPFTPPEFYMERKISDLRKEYGIEILNEKDRMVPKLRWSGTISS